MDRRSSRGRDVGAVISGSVVAGDAMIALLGASLILWLIEEDLT